MSPRRWLGVAGIAGAVAVVVAARRSRNVRVRRNLDIARLGARVGTTYASTSARKVFATAERRIELDQERELRTAEAITERLGNMKGALMKLGQMASYIDEGLPAPMREALAQLQSNAPPMSAELAAGVIERELGKPHPARLGKHRPSAPRCCHRPGHRTGTCRCREGAIPRRGRSGGSRPQ